MEANIEWELIQAELPEKQRLEDEHFHVMECEHAEATGDKKYPTLCDKDDRYATQRDCLRCQERRKDG